jgi:hypothetical protein
MDLMRMRVRKEEEHVLLKYTFHSRSQRAGLHRLTSSFTFLLVTKSYRRRAWLRSSEALVATDRLPLAEQRSFAFGRDKDNKASPCATSTRLFVRCMGFATRPNACYSRPAVYPRSEVQ